MEIYRQYVSNIFVLISKMANIQHLLDIQPEPRYTLKQIGEIAEANKKEVYVVGGVVRDLFLNRKLKEIDIMVIGDGIEFAKLLAKKWESKKWFPSQNFPLPIFLRNRFPLKLPLPGKKPMIRIPGT